MTSLRMEESRGKRAMNPSSLCGTLREEISRDFKKKSGDRPGNRPITVLAPAEGLFIVVDGDDKVDFTLLHAGDILLARKGQSLSGTELCMRMEVADDLKLIELIKDGFHFPVVLLMDNDSLVPAVRRLKAEGMFNNKPVLEAVAKKVPETFPLVYFCRGKKDIEKGIL